MNDKVQVTAELDARSAARLDLVAARIGCTAEEAVKLAVARLIADTSGEADLAARLHEADEAIARGDVIDHDELMAEWERLDNEALARKHAA